MLTWALLLVAGLLAACTQDELAEQAGILPEGKYPLQIGSVSITADVDQQPWSAGAPQTRVSENDDRGSSYWNYFDVIGVQIKGSTKSGIYEYYADYQWHSVKPVYWENTQAHKVRAWYPADGNVALDNQTTDNGLAYALYAETAEPVDYKTGKILFSFNHKLAKVRVKLEGEKAADVESVEIKTCTSCTLDADGMLTEGDTEDFIPMVETTHDNARCWEANVVPVSDEMSDYKINQVKVKVNGSYKEITLSKPLAPLEAMVNTITLTAGNLTPDEPINITDNGRGKYTITGSGDQTITINGNPTVTLKDLTVTPDRQSAIRITGGCPTLIIEGKTTLTTNYFDVAGILLEGKDTHVQIKGSGTLEITNQDGSGIGSGRDGTCGNIYIEGITAKITSMYGAGIGSGRNGHCGDIKIVKANLTINSDRAAAIGCGWSDNWTLTCGNIEIIDSDITAAVTEYNGSKPAVIGGNGYVSDSGDITITLKSGQGKEDFLSKLTNINPAEKVGLGAYQDNLSGKVGTITWKNADGTVIETIPAR